MLINAWPEATRKKGRFENFPLHVAISHASKIISVEVIQMLINAWPESIMANGILTERMNPMFTQSITNEMMNGYNPLFQAAKHKTISTYMISIILNEWPNSNRIVDGNGQTPLHCAAKNSHASVAVIKCLLKSWPESIKIVNDNGETPFHCAMLYENQSLDVIHVLLQYFPEVILMYGKY